VNPAIEHCLRADPRAEAVEAVAGWRPRWRSMATAAPSIERAIGGGFAADRVAWAFASGYQAALRALLPEIPGDALAAFCVTEEAGNRPRDIQTTITQLGDGSVSISGAKRWTTLGPDSTLLLVVGRESGIGNAVGERPRLRVARVPSDAPRVTLVAMPATRFVPEVPHARVTLAEVRLPAAALLPGDGYDAFVKPFRTIEDTHVTAAVLAYLLREARSRSWPTGLCDRLVATLSVLVAVAAGRADSAADQVLLEGALAWAHRVYEEAGALWLQAGDDPAAARWQRDAALFEVAGAARVRRAARAWQRLAAAAGDSHD